MKVDVAMAERTKVGGLTSPRADTRRWRPPNDDVSIQTHRPARRSQWLLFLMLLCLASCVYVQQRELCALDHHLQLLELENDTQARALSTIQRRLLADNAS